MDEPTAGLDPGERVRLRNFISEFSHDRIVLISTHIVSDIEYISTRNAIMKAGEIVDVGTTAELVKRIEGKVWNCIIPTSKLPECEMRLRIINQRGEDHNQVSIRYLSEHSEIDGGCYNGATIGRFVSVVVPADRLGKGGQIICGSLDLN